MFYYILVTQKHNKTLKNSFSLSYFIYLNFEGKEREYNMSWLVIIFTLRLTTTIMIYPYIDIRYI